MATQELLAAVVTLLSVCLAVPHSNPAIGRQFLYPGIVPAPVPHYAAPVPHYAAPVPQYAAPVPHYAASAPVPAAPIHLPHNNLVYYAPPAAANLVAPVPSAVRYATVIAPPHPAIRQQFVYYPGVVPGNVVVYGPRDEHEEGGGYPGQGYYESFVNLISNYIPSFTGEKPAEEGAAAEKPPEAEKPEKVQAAAGAEGAAAAASAEQTLDKTDKESEVTNADTTRRQDVPQRVVLYNPGEPQFFGNYAGLQRVNPAATIPAADKGAVSSFLLLRNFPATANYKAQPQSPEYNTQADTLRSESSHPGSPVLGYQRFLVLPKHRGLDNIGPVQSDTSSVESSDESGSQESTADSNASSESAEGDKTEESSSDESGPGGVAAAAPVGTALVGPGGMALSAPSATAVAGAGKGTPVSVSPAAQKAVKTYSLASKNPSAFIKP